MAHFEFGQYRLAQPHPLQAFELTERPVETPLETRSRAGDLVSGHQVHGDAELQAEFSWSREKRVFVGTSSGDQIPGRSHSGRSIGTTGGMHVLHVPVLLSISLKYTPIRDSDCRDSRANLFPCHQSNRFSLESDYRNFDDYKCL